MNLRNLDLGICSDSVLNAGHLCGYNYSFPALPLLPAGFDNMSLQFFLLVLPVMGFVLDDAIEHSVALPRNRQQNRFVQKVAKKVVKSYLYLLVAIFASIPFMHELAFSIPKGQFLPPPAVGLHSTLDFGEPRTEEASQCQSFGDRAAIALSTAVDTVCPAASASELKGSSKPSRSPSRVKSDRRTKRRRLERRKKSLAYGFEVTGELKWSEFKGSGIALRLGRRLTIALIGLRLEHQRDGRSDSESEELLYMFSLAFGFFVKPLEGVTVAQAPPTEPGFGAQTQQLLSEEGSSQPQQLRFVSQTERLLKEATSSQPLQEPGFGDQTQLFLDRARNRAPGEPIRLTPGDPNIYRDVPPFLTHAQFRELGIEVHSDAQANRTFDYPRFDPPPNNDMPNLQIAEDIQGLLGALEKTRLEERRTVRLENIRVIAKHRLPTVFKPPLDYYFVFADRESQDCMLDIVSQLYLYAEDIQSRVRHGANEELEFQVLTERCVNALKATAQVALNKSRYDDSARYPSEPGLAPEFQEQVQLQARRLVMQLLDYPNLDWQLHMYISELQIVKLTSDWIRARPNREGAGPSTREGAGPSTREGAGPSTSEWSTMRPRSRM